MKTGDIDSFGRPINSPVTRNIKSPFQNGMEFDAQTDRNIINSVKIKDASIIHAKIGTAAISDANIGTLTFGAIAGGTATFGGTSNGEGVVEVLNSLGGTVVKLNNQGIIVTGGSISVTNASAETILDSQGIVSSSTFPNDTLVDNTDYTTTGTTFSAVPGASLDPFVLDRSTNVLVTLFAAGYNNKNDIDGDSIQIQAVDSSYGDLFDYPIYGFWSLNNIDFIGHSWTTTNDVDVTNITAIFNFSAGTHTISLNYKANYGGTARLSAYALSYVILGT